MIISSNSLSRGSGMPHQVDDAIVHAMSGTELSRVRTELRLLPPEPINQRLLASRGADIVMQSSGSGLAYLLFHLIQTFLEGRVLLTALGKLGRTEGVDQFAKG